MHSAQGGQERVLEPLELEIQMAVSCSYRCWESNPSPPEEQPVLSTTERSFQPWLLAGPDASQGSAETSGSSFVPSAGEP